MPWFNDKGEETVICQVCGKIIVGSQVEWRPDITGHKSAGNACKKCINNHISKCGTNRCNNPATTEIDGRPACSHCRDVYDGYIKE